MHDYHIFLDVDNTLVNNKTSQYNNTLIKDIRNKINEKQQAGVTCKVYLVTGRNHSDVWSHVLQKGSPARHWKDQLLPSIVKKLGESDIDVKTVSLPFDHYLEGQQLPGLDVKAPSDSYKYFYRKFEQSLYDDDSRPCLDSLLSKFSSATGYQLIPDIFDDSKRVNISEAMQLYLAMKGDSAKEEQFRFLIQAKGIFSPGDSAIFFDDKEENLDSFRHIMDEHGHQAETQRVDMLGGELYVEPKANHFFSKQEGIPKTAVSTERKEDSIQYYTN